MSKIRNLSELEDRINEEKSWRKTELVRLRLLLKSAKDEKEKACLRRWFSVAAYAHYEGFFKAASELLFRYISIRGVRYNQLKQCILAACSKASINDAAGSKRLHVYGQVVDFFISNIGQKAKIPLSGVIETGDNLSYKILIDLFYTIGVEMPAEIDLKRRLIDELMLGKRNPIAHGNRDSVSSEDFEVIDKSVIELVDQFSTVILNAAATESFLQPKKY